MNVQQIMEDVMLKQHALILLEVILVLVILVILEMDLLVMVTFSNLFEKRREKIIKTEFKK